MYTAIATIFVSILKFIFEKIAKKKLSDKEFVDYIVASQKKKKRAGQASIEFESSMAEAKAKSKAKREAKAKAEAEAKAQE